MAKLIIFNETNAQTLYEYGVRCINDGNYSAAYEALVKAKDLGHVPSMAKLGWLLVSGKHVIGKNGFRIGSEYLKEASEKGDTKAKEILSFYIYNQN